MKKRIIASIISIIMFLGLAACSSATVDIHEMSHFQKESCDQLDSVLLIARNQEITFTSNNEVPFSITEEDLNYPYASFSYILGDKENLDLQVNGAKILSILPMSFVSMPQDKPENYWLTTDNVSIPAYTHDGRIVTVTRVELLIDGEYSLLFLQRADLPVA